MHSNPKTGPPMTEKPSSSAPISDLRRRMLQDMTNRNFGDKTQRDYIRHIESLDLPGFSGEPYALAVSWS